MKKEKKVQEVPKYFYRPKEPKLTEALVSEFKQMSYQEKLDFMFEQFGGISGVGSEPLVLSVAPVAPVTPDSSNEEEVEIYHEKVKIYHEQIRMYNQWSIDKITSQIDFFDVLAELSFAHLKKRIDDTILKVINDKGNYYNIDEHIRKNLQDEYNVYKERVKDPKVQRQYNKYKGVWDLSKEIIDEIIPFMKASAYYNYIGYLEDKLKNIKPVVKHQQNGIPDRILRGVYKEFNGTLWESLPKKQFLDMFDPQRKNPGRLKGARNNQALIIFLFTRICVSLHIHSSKYLLPRVGNTDVARQIHKGERIPKNTIMYEKIIRYLEKMRKFVK